MTLLFDDTIITYLWREDKGGDCFGAGAPRNDKGREFMVRDNEDGSRVYTSTAEGGWRWGKCEVLDNIALDCLLSVWVMHQKLNL